MDSRRNAFEPRLTACAIGSLPLSDAREAVDLVLSVFPQAPFWPQLPAIDWREGMMVQYCEGLPGARPDPARGKVILDVDGAVGGLEAIAGAYESRDGAIGSISPSHARGLAELGRRFETSPPAPPRLLKGHVTGPVTLGLGLETTYDQRAAVYEPDLARMVAQLLGLKARHQEELFAGWSPSSRTLVFFDEPSLGSIGSAVLNLERSFAVELLSISLAACKGLKGIHCCGEADLGLLIDAGADVLSFDAHGYIDSLKVARDRLRGFLESGGMLALGLVPSSLPEPTAVERETPESIERRLDAVLDSLGQIGLDPQLVLRRSMLTPSCGTSGMRPDLARRSLELTAQVAARARERYRLD